MHAVIVGCGRSGSALAVRLSAEGDTVSVVDQDLAARGHLPDGFRGEFLHGNGIHREVLEAARIADASAFIAVTSSDSINIVAARIARDSYHVPHVVGRLHDAAHAPACTGLGIPMITSVQMTVDRIHRMLRHRRLEPEHTFGNGESVLVRSPVLLTGPDGETRVKNAFHGHASQS